MNFEALVKHISTIQNTLQAQAAHAVNLALTSRNWLMGCYIVEFEQNGEDRAAYGEQLLKKLEQQLKTKGLNERRFREFRRLYLVYPQLKGPVTQYIASQIQIRQSLTAEFTEPIRRLVTAESENGVWKLSTEYPQTETWMIPADRLFNRLSSTHLNTISGIENPVKRAFYEMETIRGCWSVKELERQIASLYYERSGLSKNKEALSALVQQQATLLQPKDVINTPVTLEFLGLNERALVTENDLEQSILDNLQRFLLEMGHGFCFEARQKRILIDEDYFFADLVFYHRILKCHVIVELKIDKFHHEYASQLNMYLNYFKAEVMQPDDNPPIGILLCTEKGDTLVKYATAGLDPNIFVQKNRLSSTHLNTISGIENPVKRAFYEMETIRGCWSVKELERQIASLYYERSGLSKNKEALSALVQQQATLLQPKDVINTPVTLEFLGLNERALVTENDLEQSILDNLQRFLLEMGHGFCFEARQKRILIDEDYFFADLVFYHRILKCHVIVELKIDKFHHEYASQLNMYLNYFKAEVMQPDDNPPIGILLCTEKGDTLVKYATAGLDPNIFVQKYRIELPTEEEIKEFISSSNY